VLLLLIVMLHGVDLVMLLHHILDSSIKKQESLLLRSMLIRHLKFLRPTKYNVCPLWWLFKVVMIMSLWEKKEVQRLLLINYTIRQLRNVVNDQNKNQLQVNLWIFAPPIFLRYFNMIYMIRNNHIWDWSFYVLWINIFKVSNLIWHS